jgi:hypothetical protein|tara:strand:+ start:4942 stop:5190 length:249 start_codon:yes stop_codon:yes gene_type:complete
VEQQFFPFSPEYSTWDDWNGNLLHYYGEQSISVLPEDQWREVAMSIISTPFFGVYGIPDPLSYESWQEWAEQFTLVLNGPSN